MRGYTYYSLEGRKAAMGSIAYRFPIARQIGKRFGHLHLDNLYGAVYFDVGRAWTPGDLDFKAEGFKRDVGGQFRMDIISFYSLPTKVQFDVAYRLDEVDQSELSRRVTDDGPLKAYFTVLFGYH
jgi:outer membrane translocation and assembly module TamA